MMSCTSKQSAAVRASAPAVSSDGHIGIAPRSDTDPCVGLSPVTPQNDDGMRMDPPVSEPIAIATTPAATAAPDPPDEPPVIRSRSHGLRVAPWDEMRFVAPQASSVLGHAENIALVGIAHNALLGDRGVMELVAKEIVTPKTEADSTSLVTPR